MKAEHNEPIFWDQFAARWAKQLGSAPLCSCLPSHRSLLFWVFKPTRVQLGLCCAACILVIFLVGAVPHQRGSGQRRTLSAELCSPLKWHQLAGTQFNPLDLTDASRLLGTRSAFEPVLYREKGSSTLSKMLEASSYLWLVLLTGSSSLFFFFLAQMSPFAPAVKCKIAPFTSETG